jgi:hypothetical protein
MLELKECKADIFCRDCKNENCLHSGSIMADCPLYSCNNYKIGDCENCELIKNYYAIFVDNNLD